MRINALEETYEEVSVLGKPTLFTYARIDRTTVPKSLNMYEVRHADEDWGEPVQIAEGIFVNYFGTILTAEPIELDEKSYSGNACKYLEEGDFDFADGDHRTIDTFIQAYVKK